MLANETDGSRSASKAHGFVRYSRAVGARVGFASGVAALGVFGASFLAHPAAQAQTLTQSLDAPYAGSPFDEPQRPLRKLGLMFDLGTMDGAMMALVYRPLPWLRFNGGGGTNGAAPGVRVGTVVAPFRSDPLDSSGLSFSLDGGHFFPGDVNGLFAAFAGSDYDNTRVLERFDYSFVNLQAGWEVERGDLSFFARAGVGLLWTRLPTEDLALIRNVSSFVDADGSVEAFLPSIKIGMIGYL